MEDNGGHPISPVKYNHLDREERAGGYAWFVLLVSLGSVGLSAVFD